MPAITRRTVSQSIAQLIPRIIGGMQPGVLPHHDVTQRQVLVLAAIHSRPHCTMGAIASNMRISMPTATGIVHRLAEAGYVRRVDDPSDRRQVLVALTAKGHAFIRQFQAAAAQRWDQVLRSLEPRELEAFYRVVRKLNERLRPPPAS